MIGDVGETISYRPTRRQYPWGMWLIPASHVFMVVALGSPPPFWPVLAALDVVIVAEFFWLTTRGVDLRPDALVLRGIRTRVIPWRDITWVGPASLLGATMVGIRYAGGPGRVVRLRSPQHLPVLAPDPDFLAKARTIYQTWRAAT